MSSDADMLWPALAILVIGWWLLWRRPTFTRLLWLALCIGVVCGAIALLGRASDLQHLPFPLALRAALLSVLSFLAVGGPLVVIRKPLLSPDKAADLLASRPAASPAQFLRKAGLMAALAPILGAAFAVADSLVLTGTLALVRAALVPAIFFGAQLSSLLVWPRYGLAAIHFALSFFFWLWGYSMGPAIPIREAIMGLVPIGGLYFGLVWLRRRIGEWLAGRGNPWWIWALPWTVILISDGRFWVMENPGLALPLAIITALGVACLVAFRKRDAAGLARGGDALNPFRWQENHQRGGALATLLGVTVGTAIGFVLTGRNDDFLAWLDSQQYYDWPGLGWALFGGLVGFGGMLLWRLMRQEK